MKSVRLWRVLVVNDESRFHSGESSEVVPYQPFFVPPVVVSIKVITRGIPAL